MGLTVFNNYRKTRFNQISSSSIARLDVNNDFCSDTQCTLKFDDGLSVKDLHVKGNLVMAKSGDEVFGVDIAQLETSRQS